MDRRANRFVMDNRHLHTKKFFVKLFVVFLMLSVVSPGWVWCYENHGPASIEFGHNCLNIPFIGLTQDPESGSNLASQCCISCVDSPSFVLLAGGDTSRLTANVIRQIASTGHILQDPHQGFFAAAGNHVANNQHQTYLLLRSTESTILLI